MSLAKKLAPVTAFLATLFAASAALAQEGAAKGA